jgi:hypothetical protein
MKLRHKLSVGASLFLSLMLVTAIPTFAKSATHNDSYAVTADNANSASTTTADRNTDSATTQDDTAAPARHHFRSEHHASTGKRRGVIIGGTALTGMLVGAHVAGPVGALAGAGVGAGVGMFLAHIF